MMSKKFEQSNLMAKGQEIANFNKGKLFLMGGFIGAIYAILTIFIGGLHGSFGAGFIFFLKPEIYLTYLNYFLFSNQGIGGAFIMIVAYIIEMVFISGLFLLLISNLIIKRVKTKNDYKFSILILTSIFLVFIFLSFFGRTVMVSPEICFQTSSNQKELDDCVLEKIYILSQKDSSYQVDNMKSFCQGVKSQSFDNNFNWQAEYTNIGFNQRDYCYFSFASKIFYFRGYDFDKQKGLRAELCNLIEGKDNLGQKLKKDWCLDLGRIK